MRRTGWLGLFSAVLVALMVWAALRTVAFRAVLLVPAVLLAAVQVAVLALPVARLRGLLAVAELAHAVLIGGVLAVGLNYLSQIDSALGQEAAARYAEAEQGIGPARVTRATVEAALKEAQEAVRRIDPGQIADCAAERAARAWARGLDAPAGTGGDVPDLPRPDICAATDYLLMDELARRATLDRAEAEFAWLEATLAAGPQAPPLDAAQRRMRDDILLFWAPMLLLCGVAIQVGRATAALRG